MFIPGVSVDSQQSFLQIGSTNPTTFAYDDLSRPVLVTDPLATTVRTEYGLENIAQVVRKRVTRTDQRGRVRKTFFDARDRLLQVVEQNTIGGTLTLLRTQYTYDALDRLRTVRDNKNLITSTVLDSLGRMVSLTSPGLGTRTWQYDQQGRLRIRTTPKLGTSFAQRVRYGYEQNRLTIVDYPQIADVTFAYGAATAPLDGTNIRGRLTGRTDESGTEEYEYGPMGEVVVSRRRPVPQGAMSQDTTFTTRYDYDLTFGRLKTLTFHDGEVVNYTYDSAGQLTSVVGNVSGTQVPYASSLTYDDHGARNSITYGNGAKTIYSYHPACAGFKVFIPAWGRQARSCRTWFTPMTRWGTSRR